MPKKTTKIGLSPVGKIDQKKGWRHQLGMHMNINLRENIGSMNSIHGNPPCENQICILDRKHCELCRILIKWIVI